MGSCVSKKAGSKSAFQLPEITREMLQKLKEKTKVG
jgi:hypothetical protein